MVVKHGVDLERFSEFAEHAATHRDEIQLELSASATYEGRAGHSLTKVKAYSLGGEPIERATREYTLPMGAWREVEAAAGFVGPTDRPEPIEVALATLTGCLNVAVSFTALHEGIDIDGLETSVRLDFDPSVVFFLDEVENSETTFDDIDITIEVSGDITDEQREVLQAGARRSPVWNLMRLPNDMEPSVEVAKTGMPAADD
ncbi:OsmC family protein [Halorarius litoreus]|uniref:OsmC family protein n=1 Tax=Halorarius litoreus TaxID=2962676 RepID=UPI0020CC2503|nr:OsmC family protein [Halorarius litoreus]